MKKNTDDLMKALSETENLQDYLEEFADDMAEGTIEDYLKKLLEEKQMNKAEVIRRAELSDSYAFQVFSGRKTNPSRDTVICLAFGFGLNPDETQAMLKAFGLSYLYSKHKRDCILLYSLQHGLTVPEANELLFDNDMLTLCEKVS